MKDKTNCPGCGTTSQTCGNHPGTCCDCVDLRSLNLSPERVKRSVDRINKRRAEMKKGPLEWFEGALRPVTPEENEFGKVSP